VSFLYDNIPSAVKLVSAYIRLTAIDQGVVETLVNHLKHKKKCLFAAYAFSRILDHGQFSPDVMIESSSMQFRQHQKSYV
jgi:hypothetical protein